MDYNELKEVMVDLIEADEVSKTQLNYMLEFIQGNGCLLYTSPSPRDVEESRMPSSA